MNRDSMSYEEKSEKERLERKDNKGSRIVIVGALASMVLWFTVLLSGDPIRSFSSADVSNFYAVAISAPAAVISIYAIFKAGKRKKSY
jgi:hypothetical protein